jgi:hypothetical protein
LQRLDNDSTSTTTAVADSSTTKLSLLSLQDTQQRGQNASTTGTEWVADSDGATVDIDFVLRQSKQLHVCKGHNAESLVDLESINSILRHASVLQSFGNGQRRGGGELAGRMSSVSPAKDLSNGFKVKLLQLGLRNENYSCSAIIDRRRVRSRNSTRSGNEGRLYRPKLLGIKLERRSVRILQILWEWEKNLTFLGSSSWDTVTPGLPLKPGSSIGTISSSNRPAFCAA